MSAPTQADLVHMRVAVELAQHGRLVLGLRPFGCVIADEDDVVLATSYGSEAVDDPTRHSEILAIRDACKGQRVVPIMA